MENTLGGGTKIRAGGTKYTYSPPVPQPLSTLWPAAEIKIHFHFLTSGTSWRRGKDESPRVVTARGELGFCNWGIMSLLDVRQFLSSSLWGKGTPSPFSWYHLQNLMYRTNTLGPWYYQVWNTFKICTFWLMIDFFFPFSTWRSKRGFPILSARGTRLKSSWPDLVGWRSPKVYFFLSMKWSNKMFWEVSRTSCESFLFSLAMLIIFRITI